MTTKKIYTDVTWNDLAGLMEGNARTAFVAWAKEAIEFSGMEPGEEWKFAEGFLCCAALAEKFPGVTPNQRLLMQGFLLALQEIIDEQKPLS